MQTGRRSRRVRSAVLAVVAALTAACAGAGASSDAGVSDDGAAARPVVAATTNILGSVIRDALGDHVEVLDVMPRVSDPHSFEVSGKTAARMAEADLVVANGLGLEGGLASVLDSLRDDVEVLEIAPLLDPQVYGEVATEGEVGSADPHVWTDPARMAEVPGLVADALLELDRFEDGATGPGVDPEALRTAAQESSERMMELDAETAETLDALPADRRQLVASYHGLGYYAERYDLTVLGVVLPSGAALAAPSAADLADLLDALDTAGVTAIFADPTRPAPLAEALAAERDGEVTVVDLPVESLGEPGSASEDYTGMIRTITERIFDALSA